MDYLKQARDEAAAWWQIATRLLNNWEKAMAPETQKFSDANRQIALSIYKKQASQQDKAYSVVTDIASKQLEENLNKSKFDYAKDQYTKKFWAGDDGKVAIWLKTNQNKIEKDMYSMLTSQANDSGVDFDRNGSLYQGYMADIIKQNTPVDQRTTGEKFLDQGKEIVRGMVSTARWLVSATSDAVTWGTSYYDNYESMFGSKAKTIDRNSGFGMKVWDTMWTQMGAIDVGFGVASAVSGWTLAAPLASLRLAMWFGLKAVWKQLGKEWMESLFKESIETWFEKSGKSLMENLFKGGSHSIDDLAKLDGMNSAQYMQKMSGLLKWQAIKNQTFVAGSKAEKSFMKSLDDLTGTVVKSSSKSWPWAVADFVWDTLGLPTQLVKKTGKGVGLSMGGTMMTMYPALGALPMVGEFFSDTVLQTGTTAASYIARSTESGMYAKLQREFKDTYGMDVKDASADVQEQFEKMATYKMKYAGVTEILTAVPVSEREWTWDKIWYAGLDSVTNSIVPMAGMHGLAKTYNIRQENLAPYKINAEWKIISNINFIQDLYDIHENKTFSKEQKESAILDLQEKVRLETDSSKLGSYNQNIRSVKDLKETHAQLMNFFNTISSGDFQKQANADILNSLYNKMSKSIADWDMDGVANAMWSYSNELARYTSPEAIKVLENKVKLYNVYFEKLRESNSVLSNLQWAALANFRLSHEMDPTNAMIRGNDGLIKTIDQTVTDIRWLHDTIHNVLSSEWEYIKKLNTISGDFTGIKDRARNLLENSGIKASDEAVDGLTAMLIPSLAKIRISISDLGHSSLPKIFDEVFANAGLDFWWEKKTTLGEILQTYNTGVNKDAIQLRFEKEIFEKMDGITQGKMAEMNQYKDLISSSAQRLAQLTKMYSDLSSQVNTQRNVERNLEIPLVREVEITKQEAIARIDEEIKDRKESDLDVSNLESQKQSVEKFPDDQNVIIHEKISEKLAQSAETNDLISSQIVARDVVDDAVEAHKELEVWFNERDWLVENFVPFAQQIHDTFLYDFTEKYKDQNKKPTLEQDDIIDKNSDWDSNTFFRHKQFDQQLEASLEIVYKDFVWDLPKTFDFASFKNLANKRLFQIKREYDYNKRLLKEDYDAETKQVIIDKMKILYREWSKELFSKQIIVDVARNSKTVHEFENNLWQQLEESFWFNEQTVQKVVENMFPNGVKDMIPYWELKRTQMETRAVKVSLKQDAEGNFSLDKIMDSNLPKEDETEQWVDQYGNSTLWKQEGNATQPLREAYDVMYVDNLTYTNSEWKVVNASDFWRNQWTIEDFKKMSKAMADAMWGHDGWWIYLGDFQEEWKKKIFVRAKEGTEWSWNDAMQKLTGLDIEWQVNSQKDFETKNQIIGNLAKYAKLIWWNEIHPNKETWEKIIQSNDYMTENLKNLDWLKEFDAIIGETWRTAGVRTILFEDKSEAIGEKLHDGRDYMWKHLGDLLNVSVGNSNENWLWKTATFLWEWQFIKSKSELIWPGLLRDPYAQSGIIKAAETDPLISKAFEFMNQNFWPEWLTNQKALDTFVDLNTRYHLFDRLVPMSAYKNVFTRKAKSEWTFSDSKAGDIIDHDLNVMGVKAIDEAWKDRRNEKVKVSVQLNRSLVAVWDMKQEEINAINDIFTSIKKDDLEILQDLVSRIWMDPLGVIKTLAEKFDANFSDYRDIDFLTPKGAENIEKMINNIKKRYLTTGASVDWNYIDLTYIADYENVRDVINAEIVDKDNQDNWIILDDKAYGHLKYSQDDNGNFIDQFMMIRYPVVWPKVITAPKIIWTSELEAKWFPKQHIGESVVPNHTLVKRIEGDGDGDKIFLLTDKRLAKVQKEIVKFGTLQHREFDVGAADANNHTKTTDMQDLWLETNFDTFRGKANIGDIDNRYSEFEQLVAMGAIWNTVRNIPREDIDGPIIMDKGGNIAYMGNADYLRYIYGKTLQKAVDNKKIDLTALNEKLKEFSAGYEYDESSALTTLYPKAVWNQIKNMRSISIDVGWEMVYLSSISLIWNLPSAAQKDFMKILYGKAFLKVTNLENKNGVTPGKLYPKKDEISPIVLSEAEVKKFNEFTTNFLVKDVKKANAIFKKQDFFNADKKYSIREELLKKNPNMSEDLIELKIRQLEQKPFRMLPAEYKKAKNAMDALVAKYGERVYNYWMMRTLRDMDWYLSKDFDDYQTQLTATIDTVLRKVSGPYKSNLTIDSYNKTASTPKERMVEIFNLGKDWKLWEKDQQYFALMNSNPIVAQLFADYVKSTDPKTDRAIKWKMLSILEWKLLRDANQQWITKDEMLLPFFNNSSNLDKPVFWLLSTDWKKWLNEKVMDWLISLDPGSLLSNKMGSLGMDLTEFHAASWRAAKQEILKTIFEDKYRELNLSDQEVVKMNKKVGKIVKDFAGRWWDAESLIRKLKVITDVDIDSRRESQYYLSLIDRDVTINKLAEGLWLKMDLDEHKTISDILEDKASDVAADSYNRVNWSSISDNCK